MALNDPVQIPGMTDTGFPRIVSILIGRMHINEPARREKGEKPRIFFRSFPFGRAAGGGRGDNSRHPLLFYISPAYRSRGDKDERE